MKTYRRCSIDRLSEIGAVCLDHSVTIQCLQDTCHLTIRQATTSNVRLVSIHPDHWLHAQSLLVSPSTINRRDVGLPAVYKRRLEVRCHSSNWTESATAAAAAAAAVMQENTSHLLPMLWQHLQLQSNSWAADWSLNWAFIGGRQWRRVEQLFIALL